jgi:hypothetical protein
LNSPKTIFVVHSNPAWLQHDFNEFMDKLALHVDAELPKIVQRKQLSAELEDGTRIFGISQQAEINGACRGISNVEFA